MTTGMVTAFIGLGSNLDHPVRQIQIALKKLHQDPDLDLMQHSSLYQTPPMGPSDQPDYINAVAKIRTQLNAVALLDRLQQIETNQGRVRNGTHWGPRVLDLDLLLYGDQFIYSPRLQVPHPGIGLRNFVLYPMREIDPQLRIPGLGPITDLIDQLTTGAPTRLPSH